MSNLYERDFYAWTQEQLRHLQNQDPARLDWKHLFDEIEISGMNEKNAVDSFTEQLLIHLLLYQFWKPHRTYYVNGWENEIDEFRSRLGKLLRSKTLRNYFQSQIENNYQFAKKRATKKFIQADLDKPAFPEKCPYSGEQLVDFDFYPFNVH